MAHFLRAPATPNTTSKKRNFTGVLKLTPSKSSDKTAFGIKSEETTTTISKIFFTCSQIDGTWKYGIGGTGTFHYFGRIANLKDNIFQLSEKGEFQPGTFKLPGGGEYKRKLGGQVFNENDKGALQIVAVLCAEALMLSDCMVLINEGFLSMMVKTFCDDVDPSFSGITNTLTFPKPGEAEEMIKLCEEACIAEDLVTDISFMKDFITFRNFSTTNIELSGDFEVAYNKIKDHTIYKDMHTEIVHSKGWKYVMPYLPLKNGTLFEFFFSKMNKA